MTRIDLTHDDVALIAALSPIVSAILLAALMRVQHFEILLTLRNGWEKKVDKTK
jgi:hypothetical protein